MFVRSRKRKALRDFSPRQRMMMALAALVQLGLLTAAQIDLLRRPAERIRGSRWGWRAATLVNFVGPVAYFVFGRRRTDTAASELLAKTVA